MYPVISIIFNAPPRSGKDTLARLIPPYLPGPLQQLCFKDALYDETFARVEPAFKGFVPRKWWGSAEYDGLKDDDTARIALIDGFEGTARQCLIHVSEDIIKPTHGGAYFGVQVADKLRGGINIMTDGGFEPELVPILNASDHVLVIQLERRPCSFAGDSRRYIRQEDFPALEIIRRNITGDRPAASAEMLGKYLVRWVNRLCEKDRRVAAMREAIPEQILETFS